jgi:hypothetical protein
MPSITVALFQSQNDPAITRSMVVPLSNLGCLFRGKEISMQEHNIPSFSLNCIELVISLKLLKLPAIGHGFTLKNLTKAPWMKKSMAFASADLVWLRRIRDRLLTVDGKGNQDVV